MEQSLFLPFSLCGLTYSPFLTLTCTTVLFLHVLFCLLALASVATSASLLHTSGDDWGPGGVIPLLGHGHVDSIEHIVDALA